MKRWLIITAALGAVLAAWLVFSPGAQQPEASQALVQAAQGLDEIAIEAVFDPEARTLGVKHTLRLCNRTGQRQNAAVLRTWPNAFQSLDASPCAADDELYDRYYPGGFSAGALVMSRARVGEETVLYRYTDEAKTVLQVPVPGGWQDGQTVEIRLEYTVQIPQMAYRFGVWQDIYALGNAFAIPAVWEDGAFRTDAYAPVGDPFVSDCANYQVSVAVPRGYVCAASAAAREENGVFHFQAQAVRDFALVISNRFHRAQKISDGVLITAYAATPSQARSMLSAARKALDVFQKRWGDYPYPSLTLAQVHFPHGGMEYPGLAMIGTDALEKGGREREYTIAHETAHQWWYALVGSDGWYQPWQDEALCEFGLLEYAQSVYGAGERAELEQTRVESAMRVTVPHGITPGAPLDMFADMNEYALVVYNRGAAYLCALDRLLPEGVDAFLRDYAQTYAFGRASRQDFEDQLVKSTGEDLAALTRDYLDTFILN